VASYGATVEEEEEEEEGALDEAFKLGPKAQLQQELQ